MNRRCPRAAIGVIRGMAAGVVLLGTVLGSGLLAGCPRTRAQAPPPRPGQSASELAAAATVLDAVGESVALVEVKLFGAEGVRTRVTTGFVLTADGKLVCPASALTMSVGEEEAYARTVRAVFHPGLEDESSFTCEVLRENRDVGLALLQAEGGDHTPLTVGGEVQPTSPVFLIAAPMGLHSLGAYMGTLAANDGQGAESTLVHTAGVGVADEGPLLDRRGRLIGVSLVRGEDGRARAIPVARITGWLESAPEDEPLPARPGTVVRALLTEAQLVFAERGEEFVLPYDNDVTVTVRQQEHLIAISAPAGALPAGRARVALHFNYDDPYGSLALAEDGSLRWIVRIPAEFASATYLKNVASAGAQRAAAWAEVAAGGDLPDATGLYPGGDETALYERLKTAVVASGLAFEPSGEETFKLLFGNTPAVFVNVYLGVAYVHAFSGGMPGATEDEQEQIARNLLRRNAHIPLGRIALDNYDDLAWEAQVPMDSLTPDYLAALARVGTQEVAGLIEEYGRVPFNETD